MTTLASLNCSILPSEGLPERLNSLRASLEEGPASPEGLSGLLSRAISAVAMGAPETIENDLVNEALASARFGLSVQAVQGQRGFALSHIDSNLASIQCALLIELLAASARGYQLRRCFYAGEWFSPGLRSARSKFCSARCRNRFNYDFRSQGASFVCADCEKV